MDGLKAARQCNMASPNYPSLCAHFSECRRPIREKNMVSLKTKESPEITDELRANKEMTPFEVPSHTGSLRLLHHEYTRDNKVCRLGETIHNFHHGFS